jgi:hypothetical protein
VIGVVLQLRVMRNHAHERSTMPHIIFLDDSIFNNAAYVDDSPTVIDQVRQNLPDR